MPTLLPSRPPTPSLVVRAEPADRSLGHAIATSRLPNLSVRLKALAITIRYRRLALIGMMGTGKTTVGCLLATRLGWELWDNDEALRRATGKTAAEVQSTRGRAQLHEIEDRLLREALGNDAATVFAAAASVVLNPDALTGALTVWLRASTAWEERNIAGSGQHHRPLPADDETVLAQLNAARESLYAKAAEITVDVAMEAQETCDRVLAAITGRIE